jgi:hypothetical protein
MRWTKVCPLIGLALVACAKAENDIPLTPGLATGHGLGHAEFVCGLRGRNPERAASRRTLLH